MDVALVENAEDDVDHEESGGDEIGLACYRRVMRHLPLAEGVVQRVVFNSSPG
jgi:hypothetical protein